MWHLGHGPTCCTCSCSLPQTPSPKAQCSLLPGVSARRKRLHSQLAPQANAFWSIQGPSRLELRKQIPTLKYVLPGALATGAQQVSAQQTDALQPAQPEAHQHGVPSATEEGLEDVHGRRFLLSSALAAATVAAGGTMNALCPNAAHALRTVSNAAQNK